MILANAGLPHRAATRSFAEGLGWLAQIGLFVLLGLLVTPHRLPQQILPALAIGLVLLLAARPLAVAGSLLFFRIPVREQAFLSWAGLRGAVPIVLATFPIVRGVPDSDRLLDIVFVLVVIFTLIQGPSLGPVARRLGLVSREVTREILVESAPLDVLDAELLTTTIVPKSRLHSVSIIELRLPDPSVVTLIIREGRTFVPTDDTQLKIGDELLIVTTRTRREATERRLRRSAAAARSRTGSTNTASRTNRPAPAHPAHSERPRVTTAARSDSDMSVRCDRADGGLSPMGLRMLPLATAAASVRRRCVLRKWDLRRHGECLGEVVRAFHRREVPDADEVTQAGVCEEVVDAVGPFLWEQRVVFWPEHRRRHCDPVAWLRRVFG